ncbi:MAG: O-antigen ligase family protein [Synergistaceae bacterium]|nr:O-antigen ligase family protein [Synergistaceae bacterium]
MKKTQKLQLAATKNIDIVPPALLWALWAVSLCVPNIIYSGVKFADTLHILKWAITGVPVAIAVFVAGIRLFRNGERITLNFDLFAIMWAIVLAYCALMPLWITIFSPTGWALEMTCFVCMWAFYVLSANTFPDWGLRPVLWLANINASINVVFAELQIRNMNNLKFLEGTIFADIIPFSDIILPTPGNYIGNTAQQNMFGLWVAVAVLGAVWLFVFGKRKRSDYFALFFTAVNFWGLMNSTSRSATLALTGGLILMFIITATKFGRDYVKRFGVALIVIALVFGASMYYSDRSNAIVGKTVDILQHAENIGNRRGIWTTSASMVLEHPEGVGIGQYKWHYLEAQRYGFKIFPYSWYTWQYTHWAHNEFLQFFCEGGWIGGILFCIMYFTGIFSSFIALFKRKQVSQNSVWAFCIIALISFCALFTRPFHRIENIVWVTLAFAITNREFLTVKVHQLNHKKLAAVLCVLASAAGVAYISSGIVGNRTLRLALSTQNPSLQMYYLEEAQKHPIVYEETMRNVGYHYMQLGEQTEDYDTLNLGFSTLWKHFNHEPHSEDISRILNYAQKYQNEEVLRDIASYFRPGTYHLQRVPQKNSDGNMFMALLLVNGPGSDDE